MEICEKPGWLKVDFDKLEDSSEDSDGQSVDDWQRASQLADYLSKGRFETDSGVARTRSKSFIRALCHKINVMMVYYSSVTRRRSKDLSFPL